MNSPLGQSSMLGYNMPNCLIIPSATGSITNCIKMPLPSTTSIIIMIIVSWIIFMAVAYLIYWFANKVNSPGIVLNYWIILLILILAGFIVSLFI